MMRPWKDHEKKFNLVWPAAPTVAAFLFTLVLTLATSQAARAQTYRVIHVFSWNDGVGPIAALTRDSAGNLYGTTDAGGSIGPFCPDGCGTVYELSPSGSGWNFKTLYVFQGGLDGSQPWARLTIGPDGSLYGTTTYGGFGGGFCNFGGCGTIFKLTPSDGGWTETVIHRFGIDLTPPLYMPMGALVFDHAGNLYGATHYGSNNVYELTPAGDSWTIRGIADVVWPDSGVVFDQQGNLYGTSPTSYVYELTPSGGDWVEHTLYSDSRGLYAGGLTLDAAGNLYGTSEEEQYSNGTVFKLTNDGNSHWSYTRLMTFISPFGWQLGPADSLVIDPVGSLYGTTTTYGEYSKGEVFKLSSPFGAAGYRSLHDFTGGSDGGYPQGGVTLGPDGTIYGTASGGGAPCGTDGTFRNSGCGVVFEVAP